MSELPSRTAVVGVGNVLMADDGIGVRAIWELEHQNLPDGIELLDGGTAFPALVGQLAGYQRLIIVDAVHGGALPGTIYRFELEEILDQERRINAPPGWLGALSLHDMGVLEALMLERLASSTSPDGTPAAGSSIVFIGIEPARVEPSMDLSLTLRQRLPVLVQTILEECTKQEEPS